MLQSSDESSIPWKDSIPVTSIPEKGPQETIRGNTIDPTSVDSDSKSLHTKTPAKWGVPWQSPATIVGCVVIALGLSLAHHFVYQSFHLKVVQSETQQSWFLRVGNILAIGVQTAIATSMGITFTQVMWRLFREKSFSIGGIDNMFSAQSSPFALANWELLRHGTLLVLVAICTL